MQRGGPLLNLVVVRLVGRWRLLVMMMMMLRRRSLRVIPRRVFELGWSLMVVPGLGLVDATTTTTTTAT